MAVYSMSSDAPVLAASSSSPADRVYGLGFRYAVRIGFHEYERQAFRSALLEAERRGARDLARTIGQLAAERFPRPSFDR